MLEVFDGRGMWQTDCHAQRGIHDATVGEDDVNRYPTWYDAEIYARLLDAMRMEVMRCSWALACHTKRPSRAMLEATFATASHGKHRATRALPIRRVERSLLRTPPTKTRNAQAVLMLAWRHGMLPGMLVSMQTAWLEDRIHVEAGLDFAS